MCAAHMHIIIPIMSDAINKFRYILALFRLLTCILSLQVVTVRNLLYAHNSSLWNNGMKKTTQVGAVPMVTIWVHGTKGTARMLPFKTVQLFFDCLVGLNHYALLTPDYHHRKIAEMLHESEPEQFPLEHFYIFGWSGTLSFQDREKAARDLDSEIIELIQRYKIQYDCTPRLRIITHSHGGNVVLNLARVHNPKALSYVVNELVLLACPVQVVTAKLAQETMFESVCHLFSKTDIFQVIDMQGLYRNNVKAPLFSQRRFFTSHTMIQIALKKGHRPLAHIEFLLKYFLQALPTILIEARLLHQNSMLADHVHTIDIKKVEEST